MNAMTIEVRISDKHNMLNRRLGWTKYLRSNVQSIIATSTGETPQHLIDQEVEYNDAVTMLQSRLTEADRRLSVSRSEVISVTNSLLASIQGELSILHTSMTLRDAEIELLEDIMTSLEYQYNKRYGVVSMSEQLNEFDDLITLTQQKIIVTAQEVKDLVANITQHYDNADIHASGKYAVDILVIHL